ncbi:MAG: 3-methyl-2-oxobutanoate hydroxymethyltransferase [Candidatus Staskawiczbacteria bacterium]|nr:3-methyl-2-oxobutanoate hydroxymethyltransferase [Candidatus Staskawiczbacteria bacterium]
MEPRKQKLSILEMQKKKAQGEAITWITAYDMPFAYAAEQAGIDMILVGDSGGMVQLGYPTTNPVTMDEMIIMAKAARKGSPNTFIIGDMPQGSYEASAEDAVRNAMRFIKEAGCDAVKCEGGQRMAKHIAAMVDAGILVMGHIGLTPQSTASFGGYRVQGKTIDSFEQTLQDALALQQAGVFGMLLEAMPQESADQITRQLKIPIYGIGAGGIVDGQLIIMHDLMGFYHIFRPWFAKCYVPEVLQDFQKHLGEHQDVRMLGREHRKDGMQQLAMLAIAKYIQEVKSRAFPGQEYTYPLKQEELETLKTSKMWKI